MLMIKNLFINIHYLLINPARYYSITLREHTVQLKDMILLWSIFIGLIISLNFILIQEELFLRDWKHITVYFVGFIFMQLASLSIRTYLFTLFVRRNKVQIDYKPIGIIMGVTKITQVLILVFLFFGFQDPVGRYLNWTFILWHVALIAIGLHVLSKINLGRLLIVTVFLLGVEYLVYLPFMGIPF